MMRISKSNIFERGGIMGDLMENARIAGRGGTVIFFSNVLSTLIVAVGAIFVIRLLSPTEYGLYIIAGIPSSMMILFGDWGVNTALTKYIAQYRAEGKETLAASILRSGLVFKILLGLVLTSMMFLLSDFLAEIVLLKPEASLIVKVSCLTVLGTQLYDAAWSAFLGFEKMRYGALMQVFFSTSKALFAIILVFLGFSAFGAMLGLGLGMLAAGVVGTLILIFALYRPVHRINSGGYANLMETAITMLRYGLPLAILSITGGFGNQFYSFLMARYSSTVSIGSYGVASTFIVLVGFVTFPVGNVLLPAFSKISRSERNRLEVAFGASVKYVSFIVIPATIGVMALSQPLINVLFGDMYNSAPLYLVLLSIGNIFCGLGSLSMTTLLSSQGETGLILKIGLLNMAAGIPLSLILIPRLGILGFIANGLIVQAVGVILNIYWVRKLYQFKTWIDQSAKTYIASFIMGGIVWATLNALGLLFGIHNGLILLGVGFLTGFFSYLLLLPMLGALEQADLNNLNNLSGIFGPLKPILNILSIIFTKIIIFRSRTSTN
jgi:O-antigen/teichoic acid export membrane protein